MFNRCGFFLLALLSAPRLVAAPPARSCSSGTLYLTIDTGSMSQADTIARILHEESVRATFFLANEATVRGDETLAPAWDPYWRKLAQEGHAFGNHTWSHHWAVRDEGNQVVMRDADGKPSMLDQRGFCEELGKVEQAFHRATGQQLSGLWRAPGGRTTQNSVRFAASCGYPMHVHWSDAGFLGDELPSEQVSNQALLDRALKGLKAGDVMMMHLGIRSRVDPFAPMLKPLLHELKARGFCFATLRAGAR